MAAPPPAGPLVVALGFDGAPIFELSLPAEVFGLPRPEFGADWYRFALASQDGQPIRTGHGWNLSVDGGLALFANADLVVIPGWRTADSTVPEPLRHALLAAHARGARFASICSGAFLLAELGLLDGRRATTHWMHAPLLARRYPRVTVASDILYADGGDVLTSAGSAAGIDLLLHIVRGDYGVARANALAKRLVLPAQREGDQRQFADALRPPRQTDRLAALMAEILAQPAQDWPVSRLAAEAGMSVRTLARAFASRAGCAPGTYVLRARIARARELLETTALPVERIAELSGFGSATSLQQNFRRQLGCSPTAYRRSFAPMAVAAAQA
ncbi:helix-turn-helix domain-containing protein [Erythrobacter sp. NE805]|uniref:helix-turn-helix domain-containing protein n=1 Tax=Erythrobacter sp. NE805 TaxID=3389875 RepID=UPI00396B3FDD